MSVGWVAASVRARAMTRRRLGVVAARDLAANESLDAALVALTRTPYRRGLRPGLSLAAAQRSITATTVWNLRVLAGWAPREGIGMLRVMLGAVEAANVDDHIQHLAGEPVPPAYQLGALATAWPRLSATRSLADLRRVLAASPWGDPGEESARAISLGMRTALADRVVAAVPAARAWASGACALLVGRELIAGHRELPDRARAMAAGVLGEGALSAATLDDFAAALPSVARWALRDVGDPDELWRAEARWWARVEGDAFRLARRAGAGPDALIGAVGLLAADAWRVRAALELAARGGSPVEAFDAVA